MGFISKIASYGIRAIKAAPKLVFGTNSEAVGSAMRTASKATTGSIFTKAKAAAKAGGKVLESGVTGKAFWKGVAKETAGLPKALARGAKAGYLTAKHAGKSGIWGGIKGFFGKAVKKMPLIGTLLTIGCEIPNIFRAGKDEGVGQALVETGKAAARLTGGAVGAAIGSAICPGIGSLIGWVAGEWLTGLVVGKSYSEKKDDAVDNLKEMGVTEEEIQAAKEQGINPIELEKALTEEQQTQEKADGKDTQKAKAQDTEAEQPVAQERQGTDKKPKAQTTTNPDPYGFGRLINMLNGYGYYNPQQTPMPYTPFFSQTYADPLATNPQFNFYGGNPFGQYMMMPSIYTK